MLTAQLKNIQDAIIRKSPKEPPSETILVVVVDDYIVLNNKDDLDSLELLLASLKDSYSNYAALAVVGWTGNFIHQSIID